MKKTIPLLHDNHNHVSLYAAFTSCVDISALNAADALSLLKSLPSDRLSIVKGWKTNELPLGRHELSALPPALIINFSLHGFVVSDAAIASIEMAIPDVASRRNDQAWCEANVPAIFEAYCGLAGIDEDKLVSYVDRLTPLGIGSSDEMTVPSMAALDAILASSYKARITPWVAPPLYRKLDMARRAAVSGVKLYLDGAIGARSAAIRGPWIGLGSSMFTYTDDELFELVAEIGASKTGVSMHAIGELAIEQALCAVEKAFSRGASFKKIRIEHAQFIDERQAHRAKDLGIVLSMQPNFTSDSIDYADRLPPAYLGRNNPFRMLIDELDFEPGRDLIFGSDGMPDGIAYSATASLFPPFPAQFLSMDELAAGYGRARGTSGNVTVEIDDRCRRVQVLDVSMA